MMELSALLDKQFIDTISRAETSVGVEIELPIVPFTPGRVSESLSGILCEKLKTLGFTPVRFTNSGRVCEWVDGDGDSVSYETSWNTFEFSLHNKKDIVSLFRKYIALLLPLQGVLTEHGYFFCGRGINPNYMHMDPSPLDTDILLAKSEFLAKYTEHHDGEIFHALCASVQTHLDALDEQSFLKMFSLLRKAYVCDALFFANSLAPDEAFSRIRPALDKLERDTVCYRDEIWKYCGAPNTSFTSFKLDTIDDYRRYLRGLKLFVIVKDGKYEAIQPVLPENYGSETAWDEEMLTCFRALEPVAPTKRGTIEIRSTCVQPLDAMFEPTAFYAGLVSEAAEAEKLMDELYEKYYPGLTPPQIRDILMRRSSADKRRELRPFGKKLIELSIQGLKKRGYGEEIFIYSLLDRLENNGWCTPAECTMEDALEQTKQQMEKLEKMRGIN